MSNNIRSQGIGTFQMNLDLLAKVFPSLNQDATIPITIFENNKELPTSQSRTIVLTYNVTELILPDADNIGLEFRIQNNTLHDVSIIYKQNIYTIHSAGLWIFRWNGETWTGVDANSFHETITSHDDIFSPVNSKAIIFNTNILPTQDELDEAITIKPFKYIIPDGLNIGVELQLFNTGNNHVYIYYKNHGNYKRIWLPKNDKFFGSLRWDGESWLNITQDEWIIPLEDNILEGETHPVPIEEYSRVLYKDISKSILHIPNISDNAYIIIDAKAGTEMELFLDETHVGETINTTVYDNDEVYIAPNELSRNIKIVDITNIDENDIIINNNYNVSLSSVLSSIDIKFDGRRNNRFNFIPIRSTTKGYINNTTVNNYSLTGIVNDMILDINAPIGIGNVELELNHDTNKNTFDIPVGTKLYVRNNSLSTSGFTITSPENVKSNNYNILPNASLTLIFNGYTFIRFEQSLISMSYVSPIDGMILKPHPSWHIYSDISKTSVRIACGSKFQMESQSGKLYTHRVNQDTLIEMNSDMISVAEEGVDYYVYMIAGLIDGQNEPEFRISNLLPDAYLISLRTEYPDREAHICRMIIGGFHYGLMRKTSNYYVPLISNDTPINPQSPNWATDSWVDNTTIGIIPNSVWDLTHRPKVYDINRTDRQLGSMVKLGNGLWVDIYKTSGTILHAGGILGPVVGISNLKSTNKEPALSGENYFSAISIGNIIGKRLLTRTEWLHAAEWTPKGPNNSISSYNVQDCTYGNPELIDLISYTDVVTSSWAWRSVNGSDEYGKSYIPSNSEFIGVSGGLGENLGCRSIDVSKESSEIYETVSLRFCCESTL